MNSNNERKQPTPGETGMPKNDAKKGTHPKGHRTQMLPEQDDILDGHGKLLEVREVPQRSVPPNMSVAHLRNTIRELSVTTNCLAIQLEGRWESQGGKMEQWPQASIDQVKSHIEAIGELFERTKRIIEKGADGFEEHLAAVNFRATLSQSTILKTAQYYRNLNRRT